MQKKIMYIMKCENCLSKQEFIARDKDVNSLLTDSNIRHMVEIFRESPYETRYCSCCELETLQKRVAWIGTVAA